MNTLIPITFKLLDSNEKHIYYISPYWTTQQLFTNVSTKIRDDFNINLNLIELIDISINDRVCSKKEYIPLRIKDSNRLISMWGLKLEYLSILIRKKLVEECIICFDELSLSLFYQCTHKICYGCYDSCVNNNITTCSLCRKI